MKREQQPKSKASELTLRFDGILVTPDEFRKTVNAFIDLLIQVSEEISDGESKPLWNMSVREGSNILVAKPVADPKTEKNVKETIRVVISGIKLLEHGKSNIPHFNRRAMHAARDLSSVLARPGKQGINVVEIRGSTRQKPVVVTLKTSETVAAQIGVQHQAYGSVEGRLQTITERGTFQFVVFEALTDRGINCFVPQDKFKEAHGAFGRRVNVSGIVQYDRSGLPVSIKVDAIRIFRELSEMPDIEEFRGILKGA
jgi:hypothetical protein